jgi:LuxR family maltose regulon positive regulatory protein
LVVSWLRNLKQRVAWLSLEAEDDNLPRFISYLCSALQKVDPAIGKSASQILEGFGINSVQTDVILSSLIQDLAKYTKPILLALEDYHVIESTHVHAFVENLIEHARPHLHIILITRNDPLLPLARWRTRNQLIEIRANDLQFKLEEAAEFLQRRMGLELSQQDVDLLEERTEGWVAGLQLAALSIRDHQKDSTAWTMEGSNRDIADYLMTEVLRQLPTERREFLLQTSIVNRLCALLCNAIVGREDSQLLLESLEADNLFTLALDDTREWFRYHRLFAEFLYKRLQTEYPKTSVSALHERASHWLTDNGFITEAIEHALAANDYEYAARMIAPQSAQWMRRGETSTILKYLNQLPGAIVWNHWGLCLWYGWSCALTGDVNAAQRWTNRLEALITALTQEPALQENGHIPRDLSNAYVQVLAIRSLIARQNRDFVSAVALGEQALRLVPEESINLRTIVSVVLSSATLKAGRFDQAESTLHAARQVAYRAGNPYITFTMLLNESILAAGRGQLQRAHDLNIEALRMAQSESMEHLAFLPQFRLGRIHYFWNQLADARQYITTAIEHASAAEYPATTVLGCITLALIQNAESQPVQALQTLADAEALAIQQHESESAERVRGARAQIQLSAGEFEAAGRWLKLSGWESFNPSKPGPIFNDESFFPFCQLLIASQNPSEWKRVERLLEWRLTDSESQPRDNAVIKIRLMQALLHQARNHADRALVSLLQALELAMPENVARPFLDEGQQLIPFLRRVPAKHAARNFSQKILADVLQPHPARGLIEPLSEQELNILRLMAHGRTNPEIARKLMLAVSTVRWYAKQIFRKLGVHNRTQAATRARELNLL